MEIDRSWYIKPPGVDERLAAGGVVGRLEQGRVMLAFAHEVGFDLRVVLPKGGVDPGESLEQAARREILEEAGIGMLEYLADLGTRQRLNSSRRRWVVTHYFLFRTPEVGGTPTDPKRRYAPAVWRAIDDLPPMFWPEQRELIEENRDRIVQAITRT